MSNALFYGDNLVWLKDHKYFPDESVDLIYLDPPFNSKADYNLIFNEPGKLNKSQAQIKAFDDTWNWDSEASGIALNELALNKPQIAEFISWLSRQGKPQESTAAYLAMMAIRLIELHRVLKSTGSLFLHCDTTASHYLKILLDIIFGAKNFRNEIIWRRTGSNSAAKRFGPLHQTILYYGKSSQTYYNPVTAPYTRDYIEDYFTEQDERGKYQSVALTGAGIRTGDSRLPWRNYDPTKVGRHWQPASYVYNKYKELANDDLSKYPLLERLARLDDIGLIHWGKSDTVPRYKYYLSDAPGVYLQDIWAYQPGTEGCVYEKPKECIDQDVKWLSGKDKERLGYQTQKPVGLLERIIQASCKKGGVVFDPFCGCGTTIDAAQKLNRHWLGIDVTWLAIDLVEKRLKATYGSKVDGKYEVHGKPYDIASAEALAKKSKKEFEIWAVTSIGAAPREHDGGVDGIFGFVEQDKKTRTIIVQIKGGDVLNPGMVRDLIGTVKKEGAAIGLLITLKEPTPGMMKLAVHSELYKSELFNKEFPSIQIRTIAELFNGKGFDLPPTQSPLKSAQLAKEQAEQLVQEI